MTLPYTHSRTQRVDAFSKLLCWTTDLVNSSHSELLESGFDRRVVGSLDRLAENSKARLLLLEVGSRLDLSLRLQSLESLALLPSDSLRELANVGESPSRLEADHPESRGDDHALHGVVRGRHTLDGLQSLKSSRATGSLAGDHSTNSALEELSGAGLVEGTTLGVSSSALLEEVLEFYTVGVNRVGHLQLLASDNHDPLAVQQLLSHNGGKATQ